MHFCKWLETSAPRNVTNGGFPLLQANASPHLEACMEVISSSICGVEEERPDTDWKSELDEIIMCLAVPEKKRVLQQSCSLTVINYS